MTIETAFTLGCFAGVAFCLVPSVVTYLFIKHSVSFPDFAQDIDIPEKEGSND